MISVIVPYYCTDEKIFYRCVRSILAEPKSDIELIIVDDGSGIEYADNCEKYTSNNRVKVIHIPHSGVSAARNVGIRNAHGDWLMFVDSDDYLDDMWYSKLNNKIKSIKYDVVYFNAYKDINGNFLKNQLFLMENIDYGADKKLKIQVMESALSVGSLPPGYKCFLSLGSPCCKLYSKSLLMNNNLLFDERVTFAEDTIFSLNVINRAKSICYIDEYLYFYYMNIHSCTERYRKNLSNEVDVFLSTAKQFMKENSLEEELSLAFDRRVFIELKRLMMSDYYNPENKESAKERKKRIDELTSKEPYNYVIKSIIYTPNKMNRKIHAMFILYHQYGLIAKLKLIRNKLRNSL